MLFSKLNLIFIHKKTQLLSHLRTREQNGSVKIKMLAQNGKKHLRKSPWGIFFGILNKEKMLFSSLYLFIQIVLVRSDHRTNSILGILISQRQPTLASQFHITEIVYTFYQRLPLYGNLHQPASYHRDNFCYSSLYSFRLLKLIYVNSYFFVHWFNCYFLPPQIVLFLLRPTS